MKKIFEKFFADEEDARSFATAAASLLFATLLLYDMAAGGALSATAIVCVFIPIAATSFTEREGLFLWIGLVMLYGIALYSYRLAISDSVLKWAAFYVILVETLVVISLVREWPMFLVACYISLSLICYSVIRFCFGFSFRCAVFSASAFLFFGSLSLYLRLLLNRGALFRATRIPFTGLYYVHQTARAFKKSRRFTDLEDAHPREVKCTKKAELVKDEIRKFAGKLKPGRIYVAETHPAMLRRLSEALSEDGKEMTEIRKIKGFSFKIRNSFKTIYGHCETCRFREDGEGCRYSYLQKRGAYLVSFRAREKPTDAE